MTMLKKLTSRKLWVTLGYMLLGWANQHYGWNLPMTQIGAVTGTYIAGESAIDLMTKK
jgi:hypothetical protein